MNKISFISVSTILAFSAFLSNAQAEETAVYKWQEKKLMTPSINQLTYEKCHHSVFIYEGMKLSDVEAAMDQHFDRIEHMMFVGTVLPTTDKDGQPLKEEDGC